MNQNALPFFHVCHPMQQLIGSNVVQNYRDCFSWVKTMGNRNQFGGGYIDVLCIATSYGQCCDDLSNG